MLQADWLDKTAEEIQSFGVEEVQLAMSLLKKRFESVRMGRSVLGSERPWKRRTTAGRRYRRLPIF